MQSVICFSANIIMMMLALWGNLYGTSTYKVRLSSSWYPANRFELADALVKHQSNATDRYYSHLSADKIRAIIVPHAGYSYSGDVAAAAYRLIKPGHFKRIIILAPSHHESFQGVGLPSDHYEHYKTVHGYLKLDKNILSDLLSHDLFSVQRHAHEAEHAINVQLPFIQKFCGSEITLIPLLVGQIALDQVEQLAEILKNIINEHTLVITSSDFTHYGKRFGYTPFTQESTQKIYELDTQVIQAIQNHQLSDFDKILRKTGSTVCGSAPIKVLLGLINKGVFGDVASHIVAYDTSASGQANPEHSVSYLSLVVSQEKIEELPYEYQLHGYEKNTLLRLARKSLQNIVQNNNDTIVVPGLLTNSLRNKQGAFVTIHKLDKKGNRNLRGCIGDMSATKPLYKTVHTMTKSSALQDSRFDPVELSELPYLELSLSVLTKPKVVDSYDAIRLGIDGILLKHGNKSALYLPKVATEQHWDLPKTLESLSQKAGLDKDAFRSKDTEFRVFQSIDFSENIDPLSIMYEGYKK